MSIHRPCLLRAIDELKSDLRKVRCELENKPSGDWVNTGLGLRWVKAEPNACMRREIQSAALSEALTNKADFTKSELRSFFLGNLYHDSYIKVGNISFKPIEGPIPFPVFELTEKDLPVRVHESTSFENTILDTSAHVCNSISFRFLDFNLQEYSISIIFWDGRLHGRTLVWQDSEKNLICLF
jgi:hypothetical protein